MKRFVMAAAAAAMVATTAVADEVWTTTRGDVIYEKEVGDVAVFSYPTGDKGGKGYLYFPGLAKNYDHRGQHTGYWMAPGEGCAAEMTGADGFASKNWGQLMIVFASAGFPSAWTLMVGTCFGALDSSLVGTPKTAVAPVTPAPVPEPMPAPVPPPVPTPVR